MFLAQLVLCFAGDCNRATARRRRHRLRRAAGFVKEQVESLGATFLELSVRGGGTEGGYAKELTPEQQAQQQQEL